MTDKNPSNKVFVSAKTTQELVIDKQALAEHIQRVFETMIPGPMVDKQTIEPGCVVYDFNYQTVADFSDMMHIERLADPTTSQMPALKFLKDIHTEGSGKDTTVVISQDIDKLMDYRIINIDGVDLSLPQPVGPIEASEFIRESFSIKHGQLHVDGQKLLTGLRGFEPSMDNMNFTDKTEVKHMMRAQMQAAMQLIGGSASYNGDTLTIRYPLDSMFAKLEQATENSRQDILHVQRFENGHAHVKIDYRQLVDIASVKAGELLQKRDPSGQNFVEPLDDDTIRVVLTKGGLDESLNKLVDKLAQSIAAYSQHTSPQNMKNMGTLAEKPEARLLG